MPEQITVFSVDSQSLSDLTILDGDSIDLVDIEFGGVELSDAAVILDGDIMVGTDTTLMWDATSELTFSTIELPKETTINGIPLNTYIRREANMYSVTNILLIVIVCILTTKLIIPRLNVRWLVRKFKNLIYRPFKRMESQAKDAWVEPGNLASPEE